jgi:hypothetical protein
MAKRTPGEIYAAARAAGLSAAAAVVATAVALAESGGDDQVLGDVSLQNSTWGPSVGIWQIRTLKSETGTGSDRDILALRGNPGRQAQAMRNISNGGTNWKPWSVFTSGAYRQYLGQAQGAGSSSTAGGAVTPVGLDDITGGIGSTAAAAVDAARDLLVKLGAATLGVALLGVGVVYAIRQSQGNDRRRAEVKQLVTGGS